MPGGCSGRQRVCARSGQFENGAGPVCCIYSQYDSRITAGGQHVDCGYAVDTVGDLIRWRGPERSEPKGGRSLSLVIRGLGAILVGVITVIRNAISIDELALLFFVYALFDGVGAYGFAFGILLIAPGVPPSIMVEKIRSRVVGQRPGAHRMIVP